MTRIVKFAFGSGITLGALLGVTVLMSGCSGDSAVPTGDVKVGDMSPGEYRDAQDAVRKPKGAKGTTPPKKK